MKLLLAEQLSCKVAEQLSARGVDALAVGSDAELRGLSDPDLFDVAQERQRVVVTYNRADFEAIVRDFAATGRDHCGLILVHPVRFPGRKFARLPDALARLTLAPSPGKSFLIWLQEQRP